MDVNKLPKWAQDRITDLIRDRDIAQAALKKYMDEQSPAPFSQLVDAPDTTGTRNRYIQGRSLTAEWKGVELNMVLGEDGILIIYGSTKRRLSGGVALFPQSNNGVLIREVEYARGNTGQKV